MTNADADRDKLTHARRAVAEAGARPWKDVSRPAGARESCLRTLASALLGAARVRETRSHWMLACVRVSL